MDVTREYSDFSFSFTAHPVTKDLPRITGEQAVKNSLKHIIRTRFGERPFNPNFGSRVYDLLFENFTPLHEDRLKSEITSVINAFEPRANLIEVIVASDMNNHRLQIDIVFSIINSIKPLNVSIFLEKVR